MESQLCAFVLGRAAPLALASPLQGRRESGRGVCASGRRMLVSESFIRSPKSITWGATGGSSSGRSLHRSAISASAVSPGQSDKGRPPDVDPNDGFFAESAEEGRESGMEVTESSYSPPAVLDGGDDESDADDFAEAAEGLIIDRRDVEMGQGREARLRTVRFRRKSTLGELGVVEDGVSAADSAGGGAWDADTVADEAGVRVGVTVAVQPIRGAFRVVGRVETEVRRSCDRCVQLFDTRVDGGFEVWLDPRSGAEDALGFNETAEAVEPFAGARARVDLAPHARDAVLLALPSRALCSAGCRGVAVAEGAAFGVVLGRAGGDADTVEGSAVSGAALAHGGGEPEKGKKEAAGEGAGAGGGDRTLASRESLLALKMKMERRSGGPEGRGGGGRRRGRRG